MKPRSSCSVLFTIWRRAASSFRDRSWSTLYRRSLISDWRTTFAIACAGPSWTWRAIRRRSSSCVSTTAWSSLFSSSTGAAPIGIGGMLKSASWSRALATRVWTRSRSLRLAWSAPGSPSEPRFLRAHLAAHLRSFDPALAHRVDDRLRPVVHRQLPQDARHVVLHGLLGDREGVRDLLIRHALSDVVEDLHLARRE